MPWKNMAENNKLKKTKRGANMRSRRKRHSTPTWCKRLRRRWTQKLNTINSKKNTKKKLCANYCLKMMRENKELWRSRKRRSKKISNSCRPTPSWSRTRKRREKKPWKREKQKWKNFRWRLWKLYFKKMKTNWLLWKNVERGMNKDMKKNWIRKRKIKFNN